MAETLVQSSPKYLLTAFGFDYFVLENFKRIVKEHNLGQDPLEVAFDIKSRISFFDQHKIIQSIVYVVTSIVKDQKPICKISEAEISFDFAIENYDYFKEGDTYKYQEQFLKHLNNLAISTGRGLIFSKFSATPLQGVIMPLLFSDPNSPVDVIKSN